MTMQEKFAEKIKSVCEKYKDKTFITYMKEDDSKKIGHTKTFGNKQRKEYWLIKTVRSGKETVFLSWHRYPPMFMLRLLHLRYLVRSAS